MSYHVDIIKVQQELKLENTDYTCKAYTEIYSSSYTFNVYEMLQECMKSLQEKELIPDYYTHWIEPIEAKFLNGKCVSLYVLELKADKEKYEKYNPANGWGSYSGVIRWLEQIQRFENQGYEISISR